MNTDETQISETDRMEPAWGSKTVIEAGSEENSAVPESLNSQNRSDSGKIGAGLRTGDADDPHRDELDSHATKSAT